MALFGQSAFDKLANQIKTTVPQFRKAPVDSSTPKLMQSTAVAPPKFQASIFAPQTTTAQSPNVNNVPVPENTNSIKDNPLYQAASNAAITQMSGATPAFDDQANVTRDAYKVAQALSAKAKREMIMNSGLRDSGQYITEGILGPADQEMLQRGDLERKMNIDRNNASQAAIAQGQAVAGNLLGTTSQENLAFANLAQEAAQFNSRQDFDKWALQKGLDNDAANRVWQSVEADKTRTWQSNESELQRSFEKAGISFQGLLDQLATGNIPPDQASEIIKTIYKQATGKDLPVSNTPAAGNWTNPAITFDDSNFSGIIQDGQFANADGKTRTPVVNGQIISIDKNAQAVTGRVATGTQSVISTIPKGTYKVVTDPIGNKALQSQDGTIFKLGDYFNQNAQPNTNTATATNTTNGSGSVRG